MPDDHVLIDKPPLFCDLRPVTMADLKPGETWTPNAVVLEVRRCDEQGEMLPPRSLYLSLPPELRANTGANVAEIFRRLRRLSPDLKALVDSFALFFPARGHAFEHDGQPMGEARTLPG